MVGRAVLGTQKQERSRAVSSLHMCSQMGRTSQDRLVQALCPSRDSLLPSPLHPGSVLTSEQNHHFDLLAKCSFSHFQLFLLHLVLLKSPTNNQLSVLAPLSPRSTLPAPAATIMTFFLLELIMLPTNCNSLAAVLSVLVMLLLMKIHNADLSLNNVIKEKTTSDAAMSSSTQVEYAFPFAIFSLPLPT